ncbi:ORF6N domain-containing protein [Escherichia coli]
MMINKQKLVNPENLPVIEWQGVRVVTTETLAAGYGTDEANIRKNLSRNLERFEDGKHYFLLTGDALKAFKDRVTIGHSVGRNARDFQTTPEEKRCRLVISPLSERRTTDEENMGWAVYP